MTAGVYQILNTVNGKCYVGSSANMERREKSHFSMLARGSHHSVKLGRAYVKHGREAFVFAHLEVCDQADTLVREESWIRAKNAVAGGYNIRSIPNSSFGVKLTDEQRKRISERMKLRDVSAMVKASANLRRGKPLSAERRARLSVALSGKPKSPEHVAKVAAAHTGAKRSDETRAKISAVQKGRKLTPEQHAARFGVKRTPESIEKRVAKMRGVPQSAEHVAKRMAAVAATKAANPPPPKSAEYRAMMSAKMKGRVITPESLAKQLATKAAKKTASAVMPIPERQVSVHYPI